jgi:hypothetical protein
MDTTQIRYTVGAKDRGIYLVNISGHQIPMFVDPQHAITWDSWSEAKAALDALKASGFKIPDGLGVLSLRWELVVGDASGRSV